MMVLDSLRKSYFLDVQQLYVSIRVEQLTKQNARNKEREILFIIL